MKINHSKPYFDTTDEQAVLEVLHDKFVSSGPRGIALGEKASCLLGKNYGIPTQSGTDAMAASLSVLNLKPGTKVAVPAYICSAPLDALAMFGCEPIPVDIDRDSLAISIDKINETQDLNTVIAAHLFGIPAPFYKIENKILIEDCAQTLAIDIDGHRVGSMGQFAVCSFYATKLLTTGHGGLVAVDDEVLWNNINALFSHDKQDEWLPHLHFKMSDLNAALGLSQIGKIDKMILERKNIAARFLNAMGNKDGLPNSIFSRFIVVTDGFVDAMIEKFNRVGIESKRPVFKPLFQYLNFDSKKYPNAQWAHEHIISVPIYPGMKESEIEAIETFLEANRHELRSWPPT